MFASTEQGNKYDGLQSMRQANKVGETRDVFNEAEKHASRASGDEKLDKNCVILPSWCALAKSKAVRPDIRSATRDVEKF